MIRIFFRLTQEVHAALISSDNSACDFGSGQLDASCVPIFLAHIIKFVFEFAGAICLLMIMIGGYQIMLGKIAGGGEEAGKSTLKSAIMGLIVSALAFFIIDFFISAIGG